MPKFAVWKTLELSVEIDAETEEQAIDKMLDMSDIEFTVDACDYGVYGVAE